MNEKKLIKMYRVGRALGLLPNTEELNSFVYDELINELKEDSELISLWYMIYGTYASSGILEKCFQNGNECFGWSDMATLMIDDEKVRIRTCKRYYGKYLKNKRSKY